jgi:hypothetical protein
MPGQKRFLPRRSNAISLRDCCGRISRITTTPILNGAIGYITPKDMFAGHQQEIQAERDRKLDAAREQRKNRRQRAA